MEQKHNQEVSKTE